MMTKITAAAATAQAISNSAGKKTGAMQELGKDAFLQLLVAQLRYQNPLNPQDSSAFVAQLAQFSALEQMYNLNNTMQQLLALQAGMQNTAPAYLGLEVTVAEAEGEVVTGTVTAVEFVGSQPWLVVNGRSYPLADVIRVAQGVSDDES